MHVYIVRLLWLQTGLWIVHLFVSVKHEMFKRL